MDTKHAERAEMDALASATLHAPPGISAELGLYLVADQGALMTLATHADVLALNRIVGLGVEVPAAKKQLSSLIAFARERGTKRLFVQVTPGHEPADLPEWIGSEGGKPYNRWVRLWRSLDNLPDVKSDLRVQTIGAAHALRSGEIVAESFGMPIELAPWFASVVGRPGWTHVGAFDGENLVGTAAVYISRTVAWLGFAATMSDYRGHGAQSAMIKYRLDLARNLGCSDAVVETAEQTPDHSAPSYRNMIRFGFTEAYFRQNYLVLLNPA